MIVVAIVVLFIAINQVRVMWKTGYLAKYVSLYIVGGVLVGLAAAVPGETLRLHHYIIALVLLPACAFPTRLCLIYIAFLLGMFTNGCGAVVLRRVAGGQFGCAGRCYRGTGRPTFNTTSSSFARADGLVRWNAIPEDQVADWDGYALLVDDVLRYQGSATSWNLSSLVEIYAAEAKADGQGGLPNNETIRELPHYLRVAYSSQGSPGDFTRRRRRF